MKQTDSAARAPRSVFRRVGLAGAILIWASAGVWAQAVIPTLSADGRISAEEIEAAANNLDGLDESLRGQVVEQLRQARAELDRRRAAAAEEAAFQASLETAPARTQALREELGRGAAAAPTTEKLGVNATTSLTELEGLLGAASLELSNAQAALDDLDQQIQVQESRPARIRLRVDELRARSEQLAMSLDAPTPRDEPAILTDARRLATQLRRLAQRAELSQLEQELLSYEARVTLLNAQHDAAERVVLQQRRTVELLQILVNQKRQASLARAQQQTALAELAAADKHPVVRALAEGNAELFGGLPAVAADMGQATAQLGVIEGRIRQLELSLARSRQRLAVGGVNQVVGRLFVEERRALPQLSAERASKRERRRTIARIGLAQVRIEEQRYDLLSVNDAVESAAAEVAADMPPGQDLEDIRGEIRRLLLDRRDLLPQAADTYTRYLRVLGDLDAAQGRLVQTVKDYRDFLDGNLLWVPSAPVAGPSSLRNLGPAIAWMLSPRNWTAVIATLADVPERNPLMAFLALLYFSLAVAVSGRLRAGSRALNEKVGRSDSDHIGLTLAALAIVALRALRLPLALAIIGWVLESNADAGFPVFVSEALLVVAPFLYNVLVYRAFCAKQGVAAVHFGWREQSLKIIRRQFDRFATIGVPLVFITVLAFASSVGAYRESLGRLAFVGLMVVFGIIVYPLISPRSELVAAYYAQRPATWISRLRWLWFSLAIGTPVLLGIASVLGYFYTAAILTGLLINTVWLVLAIVVVNLVVQRWLALARRKLEWQLAVREHDARIAAQAAESTGVSEGDADDKPIAAKPLDLDAVDHQTTQLLHAALFFVGILVAWGIWAEVVPALAVLDNISVWTQTATVDGQATLLPVTLADLLLALVIVMVTVVASRNLPGLMEIAILQRLTLAPGSRYAINTLLRYLVVTVGVIAVLGIVGWRWSQLQWMFAALSVGLGFGLQEIVANFVSGLIILFERPVRVGDTVTVGQLTGRVSQMRIRATTVTDWDRKEIIVPNKSFITEQVVNWTLSDPITRIVIPVGISYGSDVQLAQKVMEQTLLDLPLVLDEPPPRVYFVGFGESSLDFKLYVFSRQLADRLPLTHAVHETILAALREHGIEIPFPQRDLHLRSSNTTIEEAARQPRSSDAP